jgi:hypothetical protein
MTSYISLVAETDSDPLAGLVWFFLKFYFQCHPGQNLATVTNRF